MKNKKNSMRYVDAMSRIQAILKEIESQADKIDIDDLMKDVEEAASLITLCKKKLYSTEVKIQEVLEKLGDDAQEPG